MTDKKNIIDEGNSEPPAKKEEISEPKKEETLPKKESITEEEVEKRIQARLAEELKKVEEEKRQAEELAKLSGAEKAKRELEIQAEKFERERQKFQLEKTELEVTKQLAEKGLPVNFASMLIADNAEASFKNIIKFESEWQKALENAVKEKLKSPTPQGGGQITQKGKSELGSRLAENRRKSNLAQEDNPYF